MVLHRKQLGALGETRIAADLISQGFEVFTEIGDNSKIDLLAVDANYNIIKLQVKCYAAKNGVVALNRRKSGPGYSFTYQREHSDVYAIYVYNKDLILYVPADELMSVNRCLTIRIEPTKNNQNSGVRMYSDYTDFKRALRGHTRDTLTDSAEGDEMVQTTTSKDG